jgi:hypothetical protein
VGGGTEVGTIAALAAPFTTVLFCHFAPRFPLPNLNLIFLISLSSSRHQGPVKTHDLPAHNIKPSSLWLLEFGLEPGNLSPLKTKATLQLKVSYPFALFLDFQARALSTADKSGLDCHAILLRSLSEVQDQE